MAGYGDAEVPGHPEFSKVAKQFWYGGPGTLGPYWEEPGRSIVVRLYRDITFPDALYSDITRLYFPRMSKSGEREKLIQLPRKATLKTMEAYTRTASSYHGWKNDFPDRKPKKDGGSGDIVDEMMDALAQETGWDEDKEFDLEWTSGIILARKKEV
jgi:trans-aconitate 3-methyltransferase